MAGRSIFDFEDIGDDLPLLPLAARRALDVAGRWLSLKAWQRMDISCRRQIVSQGAGAEVDAEAVIRALVGAEPTPKSRTPDDEGGLEEIPAKLAATITLERWRELCRLERFALRHVAGRDSASRTQAALAEIIAEGSPLTHLNATGEARMVDVGAKAITHRRAVACAVVHMRSETAQLVVEHSGPKGDVLSVARIAGIMAAKRTPELIPLCHGIELTRVALDFDVDVERGTVTIKAAVDAHDKTGVEMEAMVAASIAALTVYDMLKAVERGIRVDQVTVLEKFGGRSGHYRRDPETSL